MDIGDALDSIEEHEDTHEQGDGSLPTNTKLEAQWQEIATLDEFDAYLTESVNNITEDDREISTGWVMEIKNGIWKARFVAREFKKQWWWLEGLFAVSSHPIGHRVIDHIAMKLNLPRFTFDARRAFLHVEELENVVVKPPSIWLEWRQAQGLDTNVVWRMKKVLYGRRVAGQRWVDHLAGLLEGEGLTRVAAAPQFFCDPSRKLFLETHMDDGHGCGPIKLSKELCERLNEKVSLKVQGPHSVGSVYSHLKRERNLYFNGTFLKPDSKHIDTIVSLLGLEQANPVSTPSTKELFELPPPDEQPLDDAEAFLYRSCVGSGIYYAIDREDIQLEISVLAGHLKTPYPWHMRQLRRLGRFLLGTRDYGIWLPQPTGGDAGTVIVDCWTDSDWGADHESRKSRTSVHVEADGVALTGWATRQDAIATSSGEAETYAASSGGTSLVFFKNLYEGMGFVFVGRLRVDATAAHGVLKREGVGKIRHLDVRALWIQKAIKDKVLTLHKEGTLTNKADLGTKPHPKPRLEYLQELVGVMAHPPCTNSSLSRRHGASAAAAMGTSALDCVDVGHRLAPAQLATLIRAITLSGVMGVADGTLQEPAAQLTQFFIQFFIFIMTIAMGTLLGWLLQPTRDHANIETIQGTPPAAPIVTETFMSSTTPGHWPLGNAPTSTRAATARTAILARAPASTIGRTATRDVACQAMVTYKRKWAQPRFHCLLDDQHGAWEAGMKLY